MKKILYLMSVDWRWIIQRPHFLAIQLQQWYDVKVVYPRQLLKRWKSQKSLKHPKKYEYGICFPFQDKIKLLDTISRKSFCKAIGEINEYDAIYIGSPELYEFIEGYQGYIIYDCMDDYEALAENATKRQRVVFWQEKLLRRADLTFASSQVLKSKLLQQGIKNEPILVRNGFNSTKVYSPSKSKLQNIYQLGYIGTISSWFDFDIMQNVLEQAENVRLHMIGPCGSYKKHQSEKIHFEGVIEHSKLYEQIKEYDCLVMPFKINSIVLAVDPVKLYEYIAFGKCIISVFYPEIERFGDYVYFYRNQEEFLELIQELKRNGFSPKYGEEQQKEFINENTWDARSKLIHESIECIWDET